KLTANVVLPVPSMPFTAILIGLFLLRIFNLTVLWIIENASVCFILRAPERNQLSPYLYTTIGLNNAAFGIALERPGGSNLRAFFVPVTRHYRLRGNDGNGIYSNL